MRILYLALSYVPSRRANTVQVMKMCAALARRGHEVVLVAKRGEDVGIDDHAYYCVDNNFTVDKITRPARRGGGVVYALGMAGRLVARRRWADLVYCRDQVGTIIAAQTGIPLAYEAHGIPTTRWRRAAIKHAISRPQTVGIVAISHALQADLRDSGLTHRRVVIARDACDPPTRIVEHRRITSRPVVGYVGGLYPGRGIELIAKLAAAMPNVVFRVVGGSEGDLARWRSSNPPSNLELLGFQPQAALPALYASMDVVLMPYSKAGVLSDTRGVDTSKWASPMKMFEYMAAGAPIVSSDLPVLLEVMRDGENALVATADAAAEWQHAIQRLLDDDDLRFRLARTAQEQLLHHFTWDARAAEVMTGLGLESA